MQLSRNVTGSICLIALAILVIPGPAEAEQHRNFDVEDRLAIINLLNSYPHNIDHGLVDAYVGLFAEDAVFEIRFPGVEPITMAGHEQISPLAQGAKERLENGGQRRHLFANIMFHEQTETSASISCYLLLANMADQQDLTFEFTGQYDGWLVKGEGGWKISKWVLTSDSGISAPAPSEES